MNTELNFTTDTNSTPDTDAQLHALIPSLSLAHFIQQRTAIVERLTQAIALIREADQMADAANLGRPRIEIQHLARHATPITEKDAETAVRQHVDYGGWAYLMDQSGLESFMDAKAREEWRKQLESHELPELTADNIRSTFAFIHGRRREMFDRGVITLFQRLSWDYKTNQPFRFGQRIILNRLLQVYGRDTAQAFLNHTTTDQLDDLLRVFHVLDGKPEPDHRHGMYGTLNTALHAHETTWTGEFFSLRWFRKGSGHLTFTRPDLVDELNRILARHFPNALAAPR
jgi:hypothetical protein